MTVGDKVRKMNDKQLALFIIMQIEDAFGYYLPSEKVPELNLDFEFGLKLSMLKCEYKDTAAF